MVECLKISAPVRSANFVAFFFDCESPLSRAGQNGNRILTMSNRVPPGFMKAVADGMNMRELTAQYFDYSLHHYRKVRMMRDRALPPRTWPMQIVVYYGPTGTGKTSLAQKNWPNAHWFHGRWMGYDAEETVIYDTTDPAVRYATMLKMTASTPWQIRNKCGVNTFSSRRIVFVTCDHPSTWYPHARDTVLKDRFRGAEIYVFGALTYAADGTPEPHKTRVYWG